MANNHYSHSFYADGDGYPGPHIRDGGYGMMASYPYSNTNAVSLPGSAQEEYPIGSFNSEARDGYGGYYNQGFDGHYEMSQGGPSRSASRYQYENQISNGTVTYRSLKREYAEETARFQLDRVGEERPDAESEIDSIIRNAPTSLQTKKELKSQYSKQHEGSKLSCWKSVKYSFGIGWTRFRYRVYDLSLRFEIWRASLKVVEGRFGTAVVSYFVFLKWLLFLNIYITLLVIGFQVLPQIILGSKYIPSNATAECEAGYSNVVDNSCDGGNIGTCIIDFLEGSGWMEQTILFYGDYSPYYVLDEASWDGKEVTTNKYNLPLSYLLTTIGFFLLCFLMMLNYTSTAFQESLASSEDKYFIYCNKVFCGWDYLLTDNNSAHLKKESILYELKSDLDEESRALQRSNRTIWEKIKLYTLRLFLNIIVVAILGGAFYLIFYVTEFSVQNTVNPVTESPFFQLVISFLPSITITLLNGAIPVIFNILVKFEDYSPQFEISITLLRTVFLRLASLVILFISIFPQITCGDEFKDVQCRFCSDTGIRCWETSIGQEFYKLALTDFAAVVLIVLAVEFPRKLAAKYLKLGIAKALGEMEFEIPKNVLAIVYSQALCWIGAFYCPFLPLMNVVKIFILFYLKKWSLLHNMIPSQRPFRASRSGIFFMVILLVTFLMCIAPVGYSIANIEPSRGCGPFRLQENGNYIWNELQQSLEEWSSSLGDVFQFLGSPAFFIPLIIFLGFVLYYYIAVSSAQLGMVNLLKDQLVMEGRDKHFLLTRIDELIHADMRERSSVKRR